MNRLLNGVAIAAVLALAAPALAQNMTSPLTSPSPAPPAAEPMAPTTPAPAPPAPAEPMAKKPVHHHHRVAKGDMGPRAGKPDMSQANQLTQQLNQQELQGVQSMGGGSSAPVPPSQPMPAGPPPEPPAPMGGPRPSPSR